MSRPKGFVARLSFPVENHGLIKAQRASGTPPKDGAASREIVCTVPVVGPLTLTANTTMCKVWRQHRGDMPAVT